MINSRRKIEVGYYNVITYNPLQSWKCEISN